MPMRVWVMDKTVARVVVVCPAEGVLLEDSQQSFDTSQQQQHLGWCLVVSTILVITVAGAVFLMARPLPLSSVTNSPTACYI